MKIKTILHCAFLTLMFAFFAWAQAPTEEKKKDRGLDFSVKEYPDGVWFSWSFAAVGQTHSIYRRPSNTNDEWELLFGELTGVNGGTLYPVFTLDRDYDYEFRENEP